MPNATPTRLWGNVELSQCPDIWRASSRTGVSGDHQSTAQCHAVPVGEGGLHVEALIRVQQGSLSDLLLIIDSILSIYL